MSWEEFTPTDSCYGPDYDHVAVRYWDMIQMRYHMLKALKTLRGDEDSILKRMKKTRVEAAITELEAGHKLNNQIMAGIDGKHIKEV